MKTLSIFVLLILNACTTSLITVYNQSDNFIDIEITKENFYMECAEIDKKENKSLMTFYAINGDTTHEFIFRGISETGRCEKNVKKEYNKFIANAYRIRLVGISPLPKKKNYLINEPVPEKLKKPSFLVNWTYIRLETSKGCKAYFDTDCDPKNYWGGLFPQK